MVTDEYAHPFTSIAPFYDELMEGVPYKMWVGYYMLLLITSQTHPQTMLELGCGTGMITDLLHKEGFQITGLDISEEMIREAKRKLPEIPFVVSNASDFKLNTTYDAILSFFDSLNNLLETQELRDCFSCVYNHLNPGGSFVFDLNTPYAFEHKMFNQRNLKKDSSLRYRWVGDYDSDTKIVKVTMEFWKEGNPFTEIHYQRAYLPEEVCPLLEQAGFTQIRTYHSYSLDKPRKTSDRIHYSCIKA